MITHLSARVVEVAAGPTVVELVGDGPRLLYLHGLTASPLVARREAPPGRSLAVPWQRGHGPFSWSADVDHYRLAGYVEDAVTVLDALGWDQVDVGGTSMGAAVALRLALDHPHRVSRLFLAGPAFADRPNPDAVLLEEMAQFLTTEDMVDCIAALEAWQRSREIPDEMKVAVRRFAVHRPGPLAAALRAVARWVVFDGDEDLRRLPPTLVVGWPDDPLHPLDLAKRVAEVSGGRLGLAPGLVPVVTDPSCIARAWPLGVA